MPFTLEPLEISDRPEDDEQRRRDEAAARAADDATREALRALQTAPMSVASPARPGEAADAIAQAQGQTPLMAPPTAVEPYRGRDVTPWPGGRETDGGGTVYPGVPQTPESLAAWQAARAAGPATPMRQEPVPEAPTPRMDTPAVASGSDPGMRAPVSPTFRAPPVHPMVTDDARRAPERERARQEVIDQRAMMERKPVLAPPGRMDDGLPSEADIRGARERDVLRGVAGALGNAFVGYSGRGQMVQPRREAQELQQRRDQGLTHARTEKRETIEADDRRRRLDLQDERQARLDALAQTREERQARVLDAQLGYQQARTDQERARALQALRHEDPVSPESQRARERYGVAVMERERLRPESQRRSMADVLGEVRGMSAADIEALERRLPSITMGSRTSRAGGGTGGGAVTPGRGGGSAALDVERLNRAVQQGTLTPETAEAFQADLQSRNRQVREDARRRLDELAPVSPGRVLIPGVRAGVVGGVEVDDTQARQYTNTLTATRSALDALREYERVYERHGRVGGVLSPQARAEMEAAHDSLVAMVARIRNTGIISPTEMPTIDAALPNPTNITQAVLGTFPARLRAYRESLERNAVSAMEAAGVDADGLEASRRYIRGGSSGGGSRRSSSDSAAPGSAGGEASSSGGQVRVTHLATGQSQMMDAERAAQYRRDRRFRVE